MRKRKRHICGKRIKPFLFADIMILYIENLKEPTGKSLELIFMLNKIKEYTKSLQKNQLYFYTLEVNNSKLILRK